MQGLGCSEFGKAQSFLKTLYILYPSEVREDQLTDLILHDASKNKTGKEEGGRDGEGGGGGGIGGGGRGEKGAGKGEEGGGGEENWGAEGGRG